MALGLSHRQAVLVLYGFCVMLGAAALILTYANSGQAALLLLVLALVAFVFLRSLGYMRLDRVSETAGRPQAQPRACGRPSGRSAAGCGRLRTIERDVADRRRGRRRLRGDRSRVAGVRRRRRRRRRRTAEFNAHGSSAVEPADAAPKGPVRGTRAARADRSGSWSSAGPTGAGDRSRHRGSPIDIFCESLCGRPAARRAGCEARSRCRHAGGSLRRPMRPRRKLAGLHDGVRRRSSDGFVRWRLGFAGRVAVRVAVR